MWTQAQQTAFEAALLEYGPELGMEKGERWTAVAAAVQKECPVAEPDIKTRNQCLARYSYLKRRVREGQLCAKK